MMNIFYLQQPEPTTGGLTDAEPVGGKRKRMADEGENTVKVAKKQRANVCQENIFTPEPQPKKRGGRTRRAEEKKDKSAGGSNKASPLPSKDDSVIIVDHLLLGHGTSSTGETTNKYLTTNEHHQQQLQQNLRTASLRQSAFSVASPVLQMRWRRTCCGQTNISLSTPVTS